MDFFSRIDSLNLYLDRAQRILRLLERIFRLLELEGFVSSLLDGRSYTLLHSFHLVSPLGLDQVELLMLYRLHFWRLNANARQIVEKLHSVITQFCKRIGLVHQVRIVLRKMDMARGGTLC